MQSAPEVLIKQKNIPQKYIFSCCVVDALATSLTFEKNFKLSY